MRPEGWPRLVPRLFADDVAGLATFVKTVFGATGEVPAGRPAELFIGESVLMISDGGGLRRAGGAFLYVYVSDVDAAVERAVRLGATLTEPPGETAYGDRRATLEDRFGNTWQIATRGG